MEVRLVQRRNKPAEIKVIESGIIMEVRSSQFVNAFTPIVVIELGIIMEVRSIQLWNASRLIDMTLHITPLGSVIIDGIVFAPMLMGENDTIVASVKIVV